MSDAVIDSPILNTAFREPSGYFRFGEEGTTSEVVEARRVSSHFVPTPASRTKSQLQDLTKTDYRVPVTETGATPDEPPARVPRRADWYDGRYSSDGR